MEQTLETTGADLIDLGAVSVETQGGAHGGGESDGRYFFGGLSED